MKFLSGFYICCYVFKFSGVIGRKLCHCFIPCCQFSRFLRSHNFGRILRFPKRGENQDFSQKITRSPGKMLRCRYFSPNLEKNNSRTIHIRKFIFLCMRKMKTRISRKSIFTLAACVEMFWWISSFWIFNSSSSCNMKFFFSYPRNYVFDTSIKFTRYFTQECWQWKKETFSH